ncbi:MAG TPA: bifunctional phosphopantothenoylcysteine decarboxylase/phosphopantothenate--cysteine ligase CoaBC [Candidatus Cloacimonadota bacterium]|nr:bifunctional phosphopantothenoylcysteine decarboxylase/phosphopantothenate--cysteine ligase CoaBC [Candidatus Cloacimonadota bacterium]HQB40663.1 bifunctional phosphopantothenoylcysteine decarboxylase/phosphopantothenate--cysteine ligase CoaBC [Candidatus Cloacimonadota bacterium]
MLKGKHVLIGVSGGIAAYKSVELASILKKQGAIIKIIMTKNAQEFVTPLTFTSITGESVSYTMFDEEKPIEHIALADWAEIFIIAPATANVIGKIANGIADDLLSTCFLAGKAIKIIVPAMNVYMYENKVVQRNIQTLRDLGYLVLDPDIGYLACGYSGKGRFPEPREIVDAIKVFSYFGTKNISLKNKKILITAGANREKIDPMRFISNRSSGKMGISLAKVAALMGAEVKLVHAHIEENVPYYIDSIRAETANLMYKEVMGIADNYDIIIMCAAVADYTIEDPANEKIKKKENISLQLSRTKDILFELGQRKKDNQILVGFAAESENMIDNAKAKIIKKNCTHIIANSLYTSGKDETEQVLISKDKELKLIGSKLETACKIIEEIVK